MVMGFVRDKNPQFEGILELCPILNKDKTMVEL